jgi:hypothetical protein
VVAVKSGAQVIGFTNVQNPIASIITETQKRIYSRKRLEFGVFGVNIEFVLSAVFTGERQGCDFAHFLLSG